MQDARWTAQQRQNDEQRERGRSVYAPDVMLQRARIEMPMQRPEHDDGCNRQRPDPQPMQAAPFPGTWSARGRARVGLRRSVARVRRFTTSGIHVGGALKKLPRGRSPAATMAEQPVKAAYLIEILFVTLWTPGVLRAICSARAF